MLRLLPRGKLTSGSLDLTAYKGGLGSQEAMSSPLKWVTAGGHQVFHIRGARSNMKFLNEERMLRSSSPMYVKYENLGATGSRSVLCSFQFTCNEQTLKGHRVCVESGRSFLQEVYSLKDQFRFFFLNFNTMILAKPGNILLF